MKTIIKISVFLTVAVLYASCSHYNWVAKHKDDVCSHCPEKIMISHDSIFSQKIDTLYRVSSIVSLIISSGIMAGLPTDFKTDTVRVIDKVYDVSIWIENSKLNAKIKHLNDSITQIVVSNKTTVKNNCNQVQTITKTVVKKAGRFYIWYFYISIAIIILTIVIWYFKKKYLGWFEKISDITDRL